MNLHNPNKLALCFPRAALVALGFSFLLTGAIGCKTGDKKDDPLFGVKPPQVNPVPPTTGANPGAQSRVGVPPIPGSTSGGSTAALASLPNGRPLVIDNTPPAIPQKLSSAPNVQPIPRDAPSTPALLTTGSFGQSTPPITLNLPAPSAHQSSDAEFAPLQARGASAQFVETIPEGVYLRVLVPGRGAAGDARVYEARARDTAAAVQAVVQQIDQQRD